LFAPRSLSARLIGGHSPDGAVLWPLSAWHCPLDRRRRHQGETCTDLKATAPQVLLDQATQKRGESNPTEKTARRRRGHPKFMPAADGGRFRSAHWFAVVRAACRIEQPIAHNGFDQKPREPHVVSGNLTRRQSTLGGRRLMPNSTALTRTLPDVRLTAARQRSLYPRKRPFAALPRNDAMGHKRHLAVQKNGDLFGRL
jgi:hypothetical protein